MAQLPPWQSLDAGVPVPNGRSPGRIVALVASERAIEGGWAGDAALGLARAWSSEGEKVIVVDGALHYPSLHACVDAENVEGLSDAALFGLSVGRVAKPVDGGAFFLITAGTAVADANAVAASSRWGTLLGGFMEAGVKLILFVRDGDSGCAAFLGSASDIVVLAEEHEMVPGAVRDLEGMVRAVAGPGGASGGAALRPPKEWTADKPASQRRLGWVGVGVVLVIVVLLVVFGIIPLPGASGSEGAEPVSATSLLTSGSVSGAG
jgi:hypothetical protein